MRKSITRRQVIAGAALAAAAGAASSATGERSALSGVTVGRTDRTRSGDTLVVLFLRGGADGLNIVAPYAEDAYHRLRPTLSLANPNAKGLNSKASCLDLDGFFGLHPALAPLLPLYKDGHMAVVHAVGSNDQTRSHFEAMAAMERGLADSNGAASGWLARYLNSTADPNDSPLRAVALTETLPETLRGITAAVNLQSLTDYRLALPVGDLKKGRDLAITGTLSALYSRRERSSDILKQSGQGTLEALEAIKQLDPAHYSPAGGAVYPDDPVGTGFRQAACLIRGNVGLETAFLEMGGWDTHAAQGREIGWQPHYLGILGQAIGAFFADIGTHAERTTLVVMTEFGRRAYENFSLGTDHGRASCMLLFGGGVQGGKVYCKWPGLSPNNLDGSDLRVTTDYRDILAEALALRMGHESLVEVFPNYAPKPAGVFRAVYRKIG